MGLTASRGEGSQCRKSCAQLSSTPILLQQLKLRNVQFPTPQVLAVGREEQLEDIGPGEPPAMPFWDGADLVAKLFVHVLGAKELFLYLSLDRLVPGMFGGAEALLQLAGAAERILKTCIVRRVPNIIPCHQGHVNVQCA